MAIESRLRNLTIEQRQGNFVKQQRLDRGLSQTVVANWIRHNTQAKNIYQRRLSDIENGAEMKLNEAFAIAECFDFDINLLIQD